MKNTKSAAFSPVKTRPGSSKQFVEVSRNGKPLGMLWTWPNNKTDTHPWHAKTTVTGDHDHFYAKEGERKDMALNRAKEWINNQNS